MRRIFVALSAVLVPVLALCLSGCALVGRLVAPTTSAGYGENTKGLTYPISQTKRPDSEIFHKYPSILDVENGNIGISPEYVSYETTSSSGEALVKISMTLPHPTFSSDIDGKLQEEIETSLLTARDELDRRIKRLESSCLSDKMSGYDRLMTPSFSVSYTLTGFSDDFVSILYSIAETNYDGVTTIDYICFVTDLKAGFNVDISTLFSSGISDKLTSLVAEKLAMCGKTLYGGYEAIVAAEMGSRWIISGSDIKLVFPPQTIAPASEGTVEIELKNSEINELLGDYGTALLGDLPSFDPEDPEDDDD